MLGMLKKFEDTFSAAAFAEAGEGEAAMQMAGVEEMRGSVSDSFAAAAFAEAGCHDEAREMLGAAVVRRAAPAQVSGFLESVGLTGVRVAYVLAEA